MCQPRLYHYDGYCFNKKKVPGGRIAIRIEECAKISAQKHNHATIIRN